jgi:hypothetical protein
MPRKRRLPRLRAWGLGLACFALSAVATYAGFELFSPIRLPPEMRGQWVIVEGLHLNGANLEFFADGRMRGTVPFEGKEVPLAGRVELEGNRFRVMATNPEGGETMTEAEEILELNERRLVVQDSHGELLIMERPAARAGGGR